MIEYRPQLAVKTKTSASVSPVNQTGSQVFGNAVLKFRLGDPGRTRTTGLRFRKPPLYPAELRGRARLIYHASARLAIASHAQDSPFPGP